MTALRCFAWACLLSASACIGGVGVAWASHAPDPDVPRLTAALGALDNDPALADKAGLERFKARQALASLAAARSRDREHALLLANAWVEALACGTPIVIADAGGAHELVTSPLAGRIVARDPAAIAAGIAEILAAPPPQQAVSATVARFSWEANAAALAAYYEKLIA